MTMVFFHTAMPFSGRSRRVIRVLICWCACVWVGALGTADASSMIYKNYIVRYDRGWDILCEPYVVQPGDWVLKIFRQKGEIAHHDFRDFLGIFERLNPQVRDIDMIRPGQTIDIPLRKLEHGALPGQASGVVTIPFVTLAKVEEVLHQHAQEHQVQRGDTISQLLAARYGRFGSRSYEEGVKLFQAANPNVTDLDRIYVGQRLYLPDPAIRDETWYADMFDEAGNLKENIDSGRTMPGLPTTPAAGVASELPEDTGDASGGVLAQAVAAVGGELRDKGTFFVPRPSGPDFEIDLSRHPLLDMAPNKLLFSRDGQVMNRDPVEIQSIWPDAKVVSYDEQSSVPELVGAIFEALDQPADTAEEVGFDDQGVRVVVRAKWVKVQRDQRQLCITPIADPREETPVSLRRYLEQNGIVLKELLPGGRTQGASSPASTERHAVKNILTLTPTGQKDFTQRLANALEYIYTPNVPITFPYAGIQIQAYANLVRTPDGRELLVDFGELYGDAVRAIRQSGLQVVQIAPDDAFTTIAIKMLDGLQVPFIENPSFTAARRPPPYNATVTIQGVLLGDTESDKRTLLAALSLHPAVTDLLSASGVAMVTW
ncbi:MAG: LysM peptidoglycan-binding domain-containing protein [Desulfatitalea sp.]|nr:LysM peptidoglycan-binding domain-containing protein [Desulfatitalea sp.]